MSFFIVWRSYLKYWLEIFIDVIFIVTWFRTHNSYSKSEKEISWACRSQTAHICSLLPHQWWGNRKHWSISLTLVLLVWGWESRGHSLKAAIFEISIQLEGLDLCCIIFRVYHSQYLKEWSDFICINMLLAYHYKYCTVELSSVDPLIGLVKEDECCPPAIGLWQCPNSFAPWASFLTGTEWFWSWALTVMQSGQMVQSNSQWQFLSDPCSWRNQFLDGLVLCKQKPRVSHQISKPLLECIGRAESF